MKLLKKALLYDIANMAYLIADTGDDSRHTLHRVRDICQEGNIDRVSRVLGLAYSNILNVLAPLLRHSAMKEGQDFSSVPHDYILEFRSHGDFRHLLTPEVKLQIKETAHEYMVSMVLADWLAVTLPETADVWKFRFEKAFESLKEIAATLQSSASMAFRRKVSPF